MASDGWSRTTSRTAAPRSYEIVLFDLGGVLVRVGGVGAMQALSGIDGEDEIWRRWLTSPWVRDFERGRCTPDAFAAGIVAEWELAVTSEVFLDRFRAWPEALHDGAVELVRDVAEGCRVGCLSNTNEVHWADQASRWGFGELFEVAFLSHQLDMVKPDAEIFLHVAGMLRLDPGRILFLDDRSDNVEQATSVGFAGAVVNGTDEARAALIEHGVLPSPASDRSGPPPDT